MKRQPPKVVWISWCPDCGKTDYAYDVKPDVAGADCPGCDTPRTEMKIVGPYQVVRDG